MPVQAIARSVKLSPRKVSVVVSLVRGRSVAEAEAILSHTPRRAALPVLKTLQAAKANADNNHNLKPESLRITEISVTPGVRYKRYRPAAHGRALPFQRKTSHIKVVVDGDKRQPKKQPAKTAQPKKEKA